MRQDGECATEWRKCTENVKRGGKSRGFYMDALKAAVRPVQNKKHGAHCTLRVFRCESLLNRLRYRGA
jgi:hypothetical protein